MSALFCPLAMERRNSGIRAIAVMIYANELPGLSNIVITPLYPYSY